MNDLDTHIRETLERVAGTTIAPSRLHEVTSRRRGRMPAAVSTVVALVVVVVALGVTSILLTGGESPRAPTGEGPIPAGVEASWLVVETEDIAAIIAATPDEHPDGTVVPGTRPPLSTEATWCVDDSGRPWHAGSAVRNAIILPLELPVTEEALVDACLAATSREGVDWGSTGTTGYTVCRGRYPSRDALWNQPDFIYPAELVLVDGNPAAPGPGFPLVFDRAVECATVGVGSIPPLILDDGPVLDDLNRARDLQIAALGAALRTCLTVEQAWALTEAVHAQLGPGWLLVEVPWMISTMESRFGGPVVSDAEHAGCHGPLLDYEYGLVAGPARLPPAAITETPTSTTTVAPSDPGEVGS